MGREICKVAEQQPERAPIHLKEVLHSQDQQTTEISPLGPEN